MKQYKCIKNISQCELGCKNGDILELISAPYEEPYPSSPYWRFRNPDNDWADYLLLSSEFEVIDMPDKHNIYNKYECTKEVCGLMKGDPIEFVSTPSGANSPYWHFRDAYGNLCLLKENEFKKVYESDSLDSNSIDFETFASQAISDTCKEVSKVFVKAMRNAGFDDDNIYLAVEQILYKGNKQ